MEIRGASEADSNPSRSVRRRASDFSHAASVPRVEALVGSTLETRENLIAPTRDRLGNDAFRGS